MEVDKCVIVANSDDEDEPNERPVGGVKRPHGQNQNQFDQGNKRARQETQV